MAGVDLVGAEIVKNHPTSTGEPGGRQAPGPGSREQRGGWTIFRQKVRTTIHYRL